VRTRHISATSGRAQPAFLLNCAPAPTDPPSSKWAIGLLGLASVGVVVMYGTPRGDGHGALVTGLIVVASLRLTSAAGTFASRIEQGRVAPNRAKSAVGQSRS
jgi:MYXO-CTERM domain-containing protein